MSAPNIDPIPKDGIKEEASITKEEAVYASSINHGEVGSSFIRPRETKRGLKSRHAQMIALGGTIGTGLFVGSGQVLKMGGPLFLFLSYLTITLLLFGVATATGEMSSYLPTPGCSMSYYGTRFVSRSLGFTLGWVYWYVWAITVPAEINATALVISYWNPPVHTAVWLTIVGLVILLCNFMPVSVYGETEFWFASSKVIGIVGLLMMTIILFFGGGPKHEPLYFNYWKDPGAINEYVGTGGMGYLTAFVACTVFSVYAFGFAPELLVITGGEMENPRRNIPKATVRYFYRLIAFYMLGALAIGILVPSNHPLLLSPGAGAAASPWAIGARDAGIKVLDSIINVVIVLSAWSAGNSYLYLASRALYSLAVSGNAPAIFKRCTKTGVPYVATATSSVFMLLAYLNVATSGTVVFNWMANIVNTGAFQSWICVCIVYLRFRKAVAAQGITDLPYRSILQPYALWFSLVGFSFLLIINGFKVFTKGNWDVGTFLTSYIGVAIFMVLYVGHKLTIGRHDKFVLDPEEVDLHTGMEEILAQESPAPPPPQKWYMKWTLLFQ